MSELSKKFILALDQGTTSSRAIVFDHSGNIIATAQKEFTQLFPQVGWVEHDPLEIWSSQSSVATEALAKGNISADDIAAIGITNQRETTIVWDRATSEPIYNAIVWQDRRTAEYCDKLKDKGLTNYVHEKTGLFLDAYFSATKLKWILDNVEGARERAERGELCFGTVDSWLTWKYTKGKKHITDVTNASRTMLFNINTLDWDKDLLSLFKIPEAILPQVCTCSEIIGKTDPEFFGLEIPIGAIIGDQQSALFGQLCTDEGMTKTTYGTGCFLMMNTAETAINSKNNLLSTIAWKIGEKTTYALEGSVFVGGAAIQWLRDSLGIIKSSSESEELAYSIKSSEGVYFVPSLTGLAAPYWEQYAKGEISGLTRGSTKAHIVRAALEGIAYQVNDVIKSMEADTNTTSKELRVDGGAVANNFLLDFQSNISQINVIRPQILETTALGAAYLAGLAVGYWESIEELKEQWKEDKAYSPMIDKSESDILINGWNNAIKHVINRSKE